MAAGRLSLVCSLALAAGPMFGVVKLQVREGLPIVDGVYVNGHGPYRFLIDTGTNVNLIETNLAQSIGLVVSFRTELASATGVTIAPGADGVEVVLESVKADGQKFLFMPLDVIHDRWTDVRGVLGQWFLSRFDYTLDLRAARLEFSSRDAKGTRAKFTVINGRPAVSTSLGDLVLDSAAARIVLFGVEPELDRGDPRQLRTVSGARFVGMVSSKPLVIEGHQFWRGEAVAIPKSNEAEVDGLLPLSLFRSIYVSNSEGYVVFE